MTAPPLSAANTEQSSHAAALPPLQMLHAEVSLPAFQRWMSVRGYDDPDQAGHCLLTEAFGQDQSPRPFRLHRPAGRPLGSLYAYTRRSLAELQEDLQLYAGPSQAAILPPQRFQLKPMPQEWRPGRVLGFEIRVCPTIRRRKTARINPGAEYDAYRRAMERRNPEQPVPLREPIYQDWLQSRLEQQGGARLDWSRLTSFQELESRRQAKGELLRLPSALLQGQLTVADSGRFNELLAQGLGRHKAYGYGMLLLKPAANARGRK